MQENVIQLEAQAYALGERIWAGAGQANLTKLGDSMGTQFSQHSES